MPLFAGAALAAALLVHSITPTVPADVSGTVEVGAQPYGIALDAAAGRMYVSNYGSGSVSVVDVATNAVVATVPVGRAPGALALNTVTRRLYVSNGDDATVSVIDTTSNTVVTTIAAGGLGVAVDESTNRVYAAAGTMLAVIDGATNAVVATREAPLYGTWWAIGVNPKLQRLYVTDIASHRLDVLDARDLRVVTSLETGGEARSLTVDPVKDLVFAPIFQENGAVRWWDAVTNEPRGAADVYGYPIGVAVDWTRFPGRLYVSHLVGGTVFIVDALAHAVVDLRTLGTSAAGLALTPDGERLYVADHGASALFVVDTNGAPEITELVIEPSDPRTDSVMFARGAARDPDGDTVTLSYQWTKNGADIPGATASVLDLRLAGNGDRGDTIAFRLTASDGRATVSRTSAPLVVRHAEPAVAVTLSTTTPSPAAVLRATASVSDADGDAVNLTYTWTVNGVVRRTTVTRAMTDSFDLRSAGNFVGDTITVEVLADDGYFFGAVTSATAVVTAGGQPVR
jgi:YVTN family beta-propeller protein